MNTPHNRRSRTSRSFRDSAHGSQKNLRDVNEDIMVEWDIVNSSLGQNIPVSLIFRNMSSEPRSLSVTIYARPVFRNGFVGHKLKEMRRQISLTSNQSNSYG